MLKRLLSYFVPVNIYRQKSSLSKNIEITWANGQLVLDSLNTNYSYGSLQRILRIGLQHIGYQKIKQMHHILVLGVAGGSVIKTLVDEINFRGRITGVEIDAEIISLANEYFGLNKIPKLEIVIDDAFEFVLKTKLQYDLIIIDIFQDTTMPNFLFESFFTDRIGKLLTDNGLVLFNTMILNDSDEKRNAQYMVKYDSKRFITQALPRIQKHNELIVIQKSS